LFSVKEKAEEQYANKKQGNKTKDIKQRKDCLTRINSFNFPHGGIRRHQWFSKELSKPGRQIILS